MSPDLSLVHTGITLLLIGSVGQIALLVRVSTQSARLEERLRSAMDRIIKLEEKHP